MSRPPLISLVVAVASNGVIGRDNAMPWHLPDDLQHFKRVTMGKPILMGRKTFDAIGRALPGRVNIVLTRDAAWSTQGVVTVHSLEEALLRTNAAAELCVIGGAEVFKLTLPLAQRIYLTHVHARVAGDAVFPALDPADWRETERNEHPADALHTYAMTFSTLERIRRST